MMMIIISIVVISRISINMIITATSSIINASIDINANDATW